MDAQIDQMVHKFSENESVVILLHDWLPNSQQLSKKSKAVIVKKVYRPHGYNVRLEEPIIFRGHVPLPFNKNSRDIFILDDRKDGVMMQDIFVREFDVIQEDLSLLKYARAFFKNIVFRRIHAIHTKPEDTISYINYYGFDGKISTLADDRKVLQEKDGSKRLAYKVPHFFGFAQSTDDYMLEDNLTKNVQLHFTMNRFAQIDFWDGLDWEDVDKTKAMRPIDRELICGYASQVSNSQAPSFDKWFVCSEQFMLLCYLICTKDWAHPFIDMKEVDLIQMLIIPENKEHIYIAHEFPISRYLYAAIFLLCVRKVQTLPEEWTLPTRKSLTEVDVEPFEVWWPNKLAD